MKSMLFFVLVSVPLLLNAQVAEPNYDIFSIYFGGGSYYIDGYQARELNEWIKARPDLNGYQISIHSHTDDIGPVEYNEQLARARSEAALRLLQRLGVDPEGVSIEDFGELNPVYDNSTMEGKLRNRRVDIIIKPLVI